MTAKGRVLVVDDDDLILELLHRHLIKLGFDVDLARDGKEALSLWASNRYDLILTDGSMPGMDGLEMACKIRGEQSKASSVPIIAISGHGADYGKHHGGAGINDSISKPIVAADLSRVLDRWLPSAHESDGIDGKVPSGDQDRLASASSPQHGRDAPADTGVLQRIIGIFVTSASDYTSALADACHAGSRADVSAAAHKLKSAARLVGGSDVAALCEVLENTAEKAEREEIIRLGNEICEATLALANALSMPNRAV